jgi:ethanolamine utilization protein EutP (predicted NTPase)
MAQANIAHSQTLLRQAGVTGEIFYVSALTGSGLSKLREYLLNQNNV